MTKKLLLFDASINLALGALLINYPQWLVGKLGLPSLDSPFYASILGGVLIGIGVALLIAARGSTRGLGIEGAVAINFCGGAVLFGWLVAAPSQFSAAGKLFLWSVAVAVIGIGVIELRHLLRR